MKVRVTFTRPLAITTANDKQVTVPAGTVAEATFVGWTPTAEGAMYRLSGSFGIRYFPGYEPTVRVDHLHRATIHPEPLYRYCRKCHFTGEIRHWRCGNSMVPLVVPTPCTACQGTGHAKTYPANA
jgi:hypothetical protein